MKRTFAASLLLRPGRQGTTAIAVAAGVAAMTAVNCAHAATITVKTPGNGTPIVLVTGRFQYGDEIDFNEKTDSLSKAIVSFQSPGGNAPVGIAIGRAIRAKRFVTFVGDTQCSSACAAAWLGGVKRYMTANSHIGFHAVYNASTHLESGSGNAAFGAYLNEIGLPERAVEWISDKGPDDINLLTKPIADMMGISVEIYHETTAINTPPAQQPPAYPPPPAPEPQYGPDAGGPPGRFLYRGRPFNRAHRRLLRLSSRLGLPAWTDKAQQEAAGQQ